jgi:hypothetical protein
MPTPNISVESWSTGSSYAHCFTDAGSASEDQSGFYAIITYFVMLVGHRHPNSAQQTPSTALQKTRKFRRVKTIIDKA